MAELPIKRALKHRVSPGADSMYQIGDKVLVWREKRLGGRIEEWIAPFNAQAADERRKLV